MVLIKIGAVFASLMLLLWWTVMHIPGLRFVRDLVYRVDPAGRVPNVDAGIESQAGIPVEGVDMHHTYANVNGQQLHVATCGGDEEGAGQGKPMMLFLHGFPEFWYSWRHQLPHFADGYFCVAPDQRGYNVSSKPASVTDYTVDKLVADMVALVHHYGYDRCTVVCHDWGGVVGWAMAMDTDVVDRLIVMNAPHPGVFSRHVPWNEAQIRRSWYMFLFQLPKVPEYILGRNDARVIGSMLKALQNRERASNEDALRYRVAVGNPGALTAMLNWYRNIWSFTSLMRRYRKIGVPTLLLWGVDDSALGTELTVGTDHFVHDVSVHMIDNCSHWTAQDQPDQVNQLMTQWLEEHPVVAAE